MVRHLLLGVFLLFVFCSTFSISLSQSSLAIASLLGLIVVVKERINPFTDRMRPILVAVGLYILWLVIVCLVQDDPGRSFNHIREEWLFLIIPLGILALRDNRSQDYAVAVLGTGLLLVATAGLVMYAFGVSYSWGDGFIDLPPTNPRVRGNFTHALTFGNFAAVGSSFLLAWALLRSKSPRWIRGLSIAGGTVGLVAMLFTGSRGPVLAIVVAGLALLWFVAGRRRSWILGLFAALVLIGILSPAARTRYTTEIVWQFKSDWAGSRFFIWRNSLDIVSENPVSGVGPGNFSEAYQAQVGPEVESRFWYGHAHNDFLQAAARSGIFGALTLLMVWISFGWVLRDASLRLVHSVSERAALVATMIASLAFLVTSVTEATFYDEEVRALLMLIWAIGLATVYNSRRIRAAG